jgi:alkylation response protein AidB-like acyl-CoA dehydrogenase
VHASADLSHARTMTTSTAPDVEQLRTAVRDLLQQHPPATTDRRDFLRARFDAGLAWVHFPAGLGGRDLPRQLQRVVDEELVAAGAPDNNPRSIGIGLGMAAPTILAYGTDEQKSRWLRPLWTGEQVWCQLFSEPGAGSDLAALGTRAVRDGDDWVVSGQKVWTSSAQRAEWGILLARTDPDAPKHRGITYFLLDMRTAGIEIRPLRQMTGDAHFSEVFLDDVRIPAAAVLGAPGEGWKVAQTTLASERGSIAGGSGGADPPGLVDLARVHGRTADPIVRQLLVEAHIRSEVLRFLRYRSQTALSQGRRPGAETSVMKLVYARFMQQMTTAAMHVQGPVATLSDPALLHRRGVWLTKFLHSPSLRIAGGSDQVQANIIGERVLGLPPEPRVDRDVPHRELARAGR